MAHESRRAGAGPYREARLTPPARPSATTVATGFGGGVAAAATVARLLFERAAPPAEAPSHAIERASSLAGGARVMAVFADRDARHPEVLRVPGEPRRRGADTVVAPDVLAGNGAVAALPDGEHLRDARGELLRAQGGVVRPLPGVEATPFNVQIATSALATDGATVCAAFDGDLVRCADATRWLSFGGPGAPFAGRRLAWVDALTTAPERVEQLAVNGDVVCARVAGGAVTCARRDRGPDGPFMAERVESLHGRPPPATAIALGHDDLCLLAPDRRLYCLFGPQGDAFGPLRTTPLRLHLAMEGVDEVGLADGVGCARCGGRVECWGPLARNGWVTHRERSVRVEGVEGATAIAAAGGLVCALAGGAVGCWGVGRDGVRHPRWTPVALPERALALWSEPLGFCASFAAGGRWCWSNVGPTANPPDLTPPGTWGVEVHRWRTPPAGRLRCAVGPTGTVSCGRSPPDDELELRLSPVAGLDDVLSVVVTDGDLACARRRDGSVWCWGDNRSGVLTAAEAADGLRVVALTR